MKRPKEPKPKFRHRFFRRWAAALAETDIDDVILLRNDGRWEP